ncbi:DNA (cytosine-5-)-methyltransferase [Bacillus cereus]|nr:DNA (cytosine-5-)-methyltransferase [Bacillus cereus]PEW53070.1 DNA (cytosine-5-)-methyltransferase [Bacillus cereus]PEX41747.1 DNA (cytosine-5-)-methyltransferase [Bacillus cereus]PEZ94830.1 DNA (cytosine-5-)-methyltransferase [Bacillus cereus]PFF03807.1 DNA (cytosine-5-)-methyltransferase [Bacillus cereus]
MTQEVKELVSKYGNGENFSTKAVELLTAEINNRKNKKIKKNKKLKFIDLFAGLGGLRIGFEQAFQELGFETECIMTSEIKPAAITALKENFANESLVGDITKVDENEVEDFDFLLAGFPCQAFSAAGKGLGFLDTRGTLFFEVERILKKKKPYGFILENVEGLVTHDRKNPKDEIGRTLTVILESLKNLGYKVNWRILESQDFGVPQLRKRVFIVGTLDEQVDLNNFEVKSVILDDVLERGKPLVDSHFTRCLLKHYSSEQLHGKAIKDKRGGANNIHSWSIGLKGEITEEQKIIIEKLFKERRKKHWAEEIGIKWMDGMPLTMEQISTFYNHHNLKGLLDDLVEKGYLVMEHPKDVVQVMMEDGRIKEERRQDKTKPKGYNIVAGKLSFEFTKILDSYDIAPTLVATDVSRIGVIDGKGIRKLTIREGLRLFGYPETYTLEMFNDDSTGIAKAFDLLGNTVAVPVVKEVAKKLGDIYIRHSEEV